jgi:predicted dehydrogenase
VGGGALYDIGCYAIVAGRFLFEAEPLRVMALIERDPDFKTDRTVSAIADFGAGRRLDFTVSTQSVPYQRVQAIGTQRRLELEIPFNAPLGGATRIFVDDGSLPGGASAQPEAVAPCNMYTLQGDAFSQAVRGDIALPYGLDDALCNMRVIDAMFKSGLSGLWEAV